MNNIQLILLNNGKTKKLVFDRPGDYVVFFHNVSGEYEFKIASSDVNLDILGLYTGTKSDIFDMKTVQLHTFPGSRSNLFIKGVFSGQSKLHYRGLIRIEKNAQKTHAYQKNQNLILSPEVFVESKPYLEILANDVFCTHGSTTGRLNRSQIYYLETRGIDEQSAKKILIDGFVNEIIDTIQKKVPEFNYKLPAIS